MATARGLDQLTPFVSHPATGPSGNDLIGEVCSYFFHSAMRWQSYSGGWEADGDLRWDIPPAASGRRTSEQQIQPPNAILRGHGKLARLAADDAGPVSDREWKTVIDDWYDNGEFDETHRCGSVRAAQALDASPAASGAPSHSEITVRSRPARFAA